MGIEGERGETHAARRAARRARTGTRRCRAARARGWSRRRAVACTCRTRPVCWFSSPILTWQPGLWRRAYTGQAVGFLLLFLLHREKRRGVCDVREVEKPAVVLVRAERGEPHLEGRRERGGRESRSKRERGKEMGERERGRREGARANGERERRERAIGRVGERASERESKKMKRHPRSRRPFIRLRPQSRRRVLLWVRVVQS